MRKRRIFPVERRGDSIEFRRRLGDGDARLQGTEGGNPHAGGICSGPETEGNPKIDAQRHVDACEFRRRHSDDGVGVRFGVHRFAEHIGVAMKEPLPGVVADYSCGFVIAVEPTAQGGAQSEHARIVGGYRFSAD